MTKMVFWKCPITIHSSYVCSATPTFVGVLILFLLVTPSSGAVAPALGAIIYRPHSWAHEFAPCCAWWGISHQWRAAIDLTTR